MGEFLFEALVEDMPVSHQKAAREFLAEKIEEFLKEHRFSYDKLEVFSTPRRLTVAIYGELSAPPGEELVVGPPVNLSFDEEGNPTPAALGFARRLGVEVEELERIEKEKGEYLAYRIKKEAPSFREVFPPFLSELLARIPFPKTMRWDGHRFSRRVKSILALMDGQEVEMEAFGFRATRITKGHRIFAPIFVQASSVGDYLQGLKDAFVVVKNEERLEMIARGLEVEAQGYQPPPGRVLEFWRDSVEYPNVFSGSFPEKYMELPPEIITSSLEEEMGLYLLRNEDGPVNRFIGVADNPNSDLSKVIAGNERVVKAKLEDALYFWRKDREKSLEVLRQELENVLYNDVVGSYLKKTQRLESLAKGLISSALADPILKEAASLCKSDLVTELVGEFPSLQGVAGGLILRHQGKPEKLWRAVYDHYKPGGTGEELPSTTEGKLLSLIDKLDHLVVAFATGYRPSGSGDPLGVRRAALGIIRLLVEGNLQLDLSGLIDAAIGLLAEEITLTSNLKDEIEEFILKRAEQKFSSEGYPIQHIRAVLEAEGLRLPVAYSKLKALERIKDSEALTALIQTHRRIKNITLGQEPKKLAPERFSSPYEKNLLEILTTVDSASQVFIEKMDYLSLLDGLLSVVPFINDLFENLMIMDKDQEVRENRIALLQMADEVLSRFIDFTRLQEP